MTGGAFTPEAREAIKHRDMWGCSWCGKPCADGHVHHRRPRMAGGTRREWVGQCPNGVWLHAGCHEYVESHRDEARARGFLLPDGVTAVDVPLVDARGDRWLLVEDTRLMVRPDGSTWIDPSEVPGWVAGQHPNA